MLENWRKSNIFLRKKACNKKNFCTFAAEMNVYSVFLIYIL